MDDIDRKLLGLLRIDARAPVARLAKAVNLSRGAAQNRIDRMIARGDITGFTVRGSASADRDRVRAIMAIAVEGERSGAVLRRLRGLRGGRGGAHDQRPLGHDRRAEYREPRRASAPPWTRSA